MNKRKAKEFQKAAAAAADKLTTAQAFLDDGALATAARLYREAADLLDQAASARNAAIGLPDVTAANAAQARAEGWS